jgi:hypothetical protein
MLRHEDFYSWEGPRPDVTVHGRAGRLPVFYHDNDVFMSVHPASYGAVAEALPSKVIRPVRWRDGRALVALTAFRYHAVTFTDADARTDTVTPYGEVSIAAVVTTGAAPRVLPLLRPRLAAFVLHLPVTTAEARDAGVVLYGFPKFLADMDFTEGTNVRRVDLSEGGASILTLSVRSYGPVLPDRRPLVAYSALHGDLLETVIRVRGHMQATVGSSAGDLRLGEHEVAQQLRALDISPAPVAAFSYLDHRSLLPAARVIGRARDYVGYRGADRDLGRFTVSYPGSAPLDQYAPIARAAEEVTVP